MLPQWVPIDVDVEERHVSHFDFLLAVLQNLYHIPLQQVLARCLVDRAIVVEAADGNISGAFLAFEVKHLQAKLWDALHIDFGVEVEPVGHNLEQFLDFLLLAQLVLNAIQTLHYLRNVAALQKSTLLVDAMVPKL